MKHQLIRGGVSGLLLVAALTYYAPWTIGQKAAGQPQQQSDARPRVFVETGPPSEVIDQASLQRSQQDFTSGFNTWCPAIVITENRSRSSYTIRLSIVATYEPP